MAFDAVLLLVFFALGIVCACVCDVLVARAAALPSFKLLCLVVLYLTCLSLGLLLRERSLRELLLLLDLCSLRVWAICDALCLRLGGVRERERERDLDLARFSLP